MAASYSTGTATGPTDLLQKLVTWLVAQGWTQDSSASSGAGWRAHLHKGAQYVNLRALVNEAANISTAWGSGAAASTAGYGIALYLGDGYNGSNAWNAQSGGPKDTTASTLPLGVGLYLTSSAIPVYHFLDDGNDHVTVIVDRGSSVYGHMGWGPSLAKMGYTSDYWYFYGSSPGFFCATPATSANPGIEQTAGAPMAFSFTISGQHYATGFFRVDASVFTNRWIGMTEVVGASTQFGYTGRQGRCALDVAPTPLTPSSEWIDATKAFARAWQTAFSGALLLPLHCFAAAASARWIPVGYPPTVFACAAVGHGFSAGSIYAVGGLNYLLFPGFAVRKAA